MRVMQTLRHLTTPTPYSLHRLCGVALSTFALQERDQLKVNSTSTESVLDEVDLNNPSQNTVEYRLLHKKVREVTKELTDALQSKEVSALPLDLYYHISSAIHPLPLPYCCFIIHIVQLRSMRRS